MDFTKQLTDLLDDTAKKLNFTKYSINLNLNAQKGDGNIGDLYKVSITDDVTNTPLHLAIKRAPTDLNRREINPVELAYKNEIFFYSEIYPAFREFEKEHGVEKPFAAIPGYVNSCSEIGKEVIVLKDITKQGFVMREKELLFNDQHARLIFKSYGHFHAISFCLRDQKPEEFKRLTEPLFNLWQKYAEKDSFPGFITSTAEECLGSLDPETDGPLIEKFRKCVVDAFKIYQESYKYDGQYLGILHGDCWSNNMMFKYQDQKDYFKIQDINLLDFQLVNVSTPVHDLSYFFYSGGSKELFDKLEEYLDIYYDSFSNTAKNLNSDPNKLFPRKALSDEWRKYCKFGMLLGAEFIKVKLISKKDVLEMIEAVEQQTDDNEKMQMRYDVDLFKKRVRDLLVHLYEIDAL